MTMPNGATSAQTGQQFPFNISIDDSRRLRIAVEQLSVGDMDQAMFDHIVGELAKQYDQEKIQEAIDRFRSRSDSESKETDLKLPIVPIEDFKDQSQREALAY